MLEGLLKIVKVGEVFVSCGIVEFGIVVMVVVVGGEEVFFFGSCEIVVGSDFDVYSEVSFFG